MAALAIILFSVGYAIASYCVSSCVIENCIGDESMASYLGSIGALGSFVSCLGYGKVYESLGCWNAVAAYGISAVAFLVLFLAPSVAMACAG